MDIDNLETTHAMTRLIVAGVALLPLRRGVLRRRRRRLRALPFSPRRRKQRAQVGGISLLTSTLLLLLLLWWRSVPRRRWSPARCRGAHSSLAHVQRLAVARALPAPLRRRGTKTVAHVAVLAEAQPAAPAESHGNAFEQRADIECRQTRRTHVGLRSAAAVVPLPMPPPPPLLLMPTLCTLHGDIGAAKESIRSPPATVTARSAGQRVRGDERDEHRGEEHAEHQNGKPARRREYRKEEKRKQQQHDEECARIDAIEQITRRGNEVVVVIVIVEVVVKVVAAEVVETLLFLAFAAVDCDSPSCSTPAPTTRGRRRSTPARAPRRYAKRLGIRVDIRARARARRVVWRNRAEPCLASALPHGVARVANGGAVDPHVRVLAVLVAARSVTPRSAAPARQPCLQRASRHD